LDDNSIQIGPFEWQPTQGLFKNGREIRVSPRALAVLDALARQAGRIVTKQELFSTVWSDTVVSDSALSSCIRELRSAMGDDARNPRFIETVHRRGFRLLNHGETQTRDMSAANTTRQRKDWSKTAKGEAALEQAHAIAAQVLDAGASTLLIQGKAGAGKAMLADQLFADLARNDEWRIARTVCMHPADQGCAFGPLLDVFERLASIVSGSDLASALERTAACWVAELSTRREKNNGSRLLQLTSGATASWRQRELSTALQVMARHVPLALCIENLHWCDEQTLAWIEEFNASLIESPVLLVLTTDADARAHSPGSSNGGSEPWNGIADQVIDLKGPEQGTDSQRRQCLNELEAPLREVMQAASVVGRRFTAAEIAAVLEQPDSEVGQRLMSLSDGASLLVPQGMDSWPDGTRTPAYLLIREGDQLKLLGEVDSADRRRWLQRLAARLAVGWQSRPSRIASRLADIHELMDDFCGAARALLKAGQAARSMGSHGVAIRNFSRARRLLESLPPGIDRELLKVDADTSLCRELVFTGGLASEAAFEHFKAAQEGVRALPVSAERCWLTWRLWIYQLNRGPVGKAQKLAEELVVLGRQVGDSALVLNGHHAMWSTSLMRGDFAAVLSHTRQGMNVCSSGASGSPAMTCGCTLHDAHVTDHHPAVCAASFSAFADAVRGRHKTMARSLDAIITHGRDVGHPFTLALALVLAGTVHAAVGDAGRARLRAAEGRTHAHLHGFQALEAWAAVYEGWARVMLGEEAMGMQCLDQGLEVSAAAGLILFRPFQLVLAASAKAAVGSLDDAAECVEEAFALTERVGDELALAEMHRLRGEIAALRASSPENRRLAIADLNAAHEIATRQGADFWASRAADSLDKLRRNVVTELPTPANRVQR